jgi:hypothetical protein
VVRPALPTLGPIARMPRCRLRFAAIGETSPSVEQPIDAAHQERGVNRSWHCRLPEKVLSMPHKPTPRLACRCENVVNFERVFRGAALAARQCKERGLHRTVREYQVTSPGEVETGLRGFCLCLFGGDVADHGVPPLLIVGSLQFSRAGPKGI